MNIARINKATGLVENTEVWAEVPAETAEHLFVEAGSSGIGWSWSGGEFVPPTSDAPEPRRLIPKSVVQERVNAIGKWAAMIDAIMPDGRPSIFYARWFAPNHPNVYFDDPDLLAMLAAVGCTQAQIDAVTAP